MRQSKGSCSKENGLAMQVQSVKGRMCRLEPVPTTGPFQPSARHGVTSGCITITTTTRRPTTNMLLLLELRASNRNIFMHVRSPPPARNRVKTHRKFHFLAHVHKRVQSSRSKLPMQKLKPSTNIAPVLAFYDIGAKGCASAHRSAWPLCHRLPGCPVRFVAKEMSTRTLCG